VPEPKAAAGTYPTLTPGEQQALDRIRSEGNIRLEQERIAWGFALGQLVATSEPGTRSVIGSSRSHPDSR